MKKLRVDVWSDIACPWCWVGKRHFEAALAQFAAKEEVELVWHAFELDPSAPREVAPGTSYVDRLTKKYGPQAGAMIDRMTKVGTLDGLEFRFDRARPANTFDAHRVLRFALDHGKQDALKERFFRAHFTEGESLGDHETLARLAGEVGLDVEAVRKVLADETHAADVRVEEQEAADIGIQGVPFFVVGRKYAVSGAQPAELLRRVLDTAWSELGPKALVAVDGDADACGPDGCAVPQR